MTVVFVSKLHQHIFKCSRHLSSILPKGPHRRCLRVVVSWFLEAIGKSQREHMQTATVWKQNETQWNRNSKHGGPMWSCIIDANQTWSENIQDQTGSKYNSEKMPGTPWKSNSSGCDVVYRCIFWYYLINDAMQIMQACGGSAKCGEHSLDTTHSFTEDMDMIFLVRWKAASAACDSLTVYITSEISPCITADTAKTQIRSTLPSIWCGASLGTRSARIRLSEQVLPIHIILPHR